jgi:APA family basic amino acid/polyamine antiporter
MPFTRFADSPEPLALILREMGQGGVARIVGIAAVIALPTVLLGFLYGQSRIFLVMARDGFLPQSLAKISRRGTPVRITIVTAILVAIIAGVLPIDEIAALANAGTLIAFAAVGACLLVLRRRSPDIKRPFRAPAAWFVGLGAIGGCAYLFASLPMMTIMACLAWNAIGLAVYFLYGQRRATARENKL